VAAYVEATNSFDLERLLATFAEDALVNDQLRDYWGKPAIREWAKHDIIGERSDDERNQGDQPLWELHRDGQCPMATMTSAGLPDPLVLAFYFTAQSDLIVQLIILRNRYDI